MADALSITALSMFNDMQRLSTLSHNLANATTPAFRREISYSRPSGEVESFAQHFAAAGLQVTLPTVLGTTDHRPGTLRSTGSAFDVAIEGDGWFEVQVDDGLAYTRQGDFQRDARGRLVTRDGLPVLGSSGEITLGSGTLRIDTQGRIFEDQRPAGQLRVMRFEQPASLIAAGSGLFRSTIAPALPMEDARVRQGHVENSNLQTAAEMVRLIETMRHFESSQKLVQGIDDVMGRAIRTLGEY